MTRVEELCRALCAVDGRDAEQWSSRQPHAEAVMVLFNRWAPYLHMATCGCPQCQTIREIVSPVPLGTCPECGTQIQVLSA